MKEKKHCPEVERLMGGRSPFITRHGITIVAIVMLLAGIALLLSDGPVHQLMTEVLDYTIHQISSKL